MEKTTIDIFREKVKALGWSTKELPIRKQESIRAWKVYALKGDKSLQVEGKSIESAYQQIWSMLGIKK